MLMSDVVCQAEFEVDGAQIKYVEHADESFTLLIRDHDFSAFGGRDYDGALARVRELAPDSLPTERLRALIQARNTAFH